MYLVNQWIVSGELVVSKDQRARRIKWSDIEVQIYTIISGKNYGQVGNFRDGAGWWTIKQAEYHEMLWTQAIFILFSFIFLTL